MNFKQNTIYLQKYFEKLSKLCILLFDFNNYSKWKI